MTTAPAEPAAPAAPAPAQGSAVATGHVAAANVTPAAVPAANANANANTAPPTEADETDDLTQAMGDLAVDLDAPYQLHPLTPVPVDAVSPPAVYHGDGCPPALLGWASRTRTRRVYVVFAGHKSGMHKSWAEAQTQVDGFSHNSHQSYSVGNIRVAWEDWAKACMAGGVVGVVNSISLVGPVIRGRSPAGTAAAATAPRDPLPPAYEEQLPTPPRGLTAYAATTTTYYAPHGATVTLPVATAPATAVAATQYLHTIGVGTDRSMSRASSSSRAPRSRSRRD